MVNILISGERIEYGELENSKRSRALELYLEALGFEPIRAYGRYKGSDEISFLVTTEGDDSKSIEKLSSVASVFDQESILKIEGNSGVILDTDLKPISNSMQLTISLETERPKKDHTAFQRESGLEIWTFNVT